MNTKIHVRSAMQAHLDIRLAIKGIYANKFMLKIDKVSENE